MPTVLTMISVFWYATKTANTEALSYGEIRIQLAESAP